MEKGDKDGYWELRYPLPFMNKDADLMTRWEYLNDVEQLNSIALWATACDAKAILVWVEGPYPRRHVTPRKAKS